MHKFGKCFVPFIGLLTMQPAQAADEAEQCGIFLQKDGKVELSAVANLSIVRMTAGDGEVPAIKIPEGSSVGGYWCRRSDIVPADNDYKVLLKGYPFAIMDPVKGRVLWLEIVKGQLEVQTKDGELTPDELARAQAQVNKMQLKFLKPAP